MSNLLLITDVARLRKIFSRLAEDKNIRLRVVNNLEKGGEEIAIEKPDVVFVQTHLSGLSAEILLMHLKKQLGRRRSKFVLLATPGETSDAILKPYQGWLDTSADDAPLLSELQHLIVTLLSKAKKSEEPVPPLASASTEFMAQPVSSEESSALLAPLAAVEEAPEQHTGTELQHVVTTPGSSEPSLEEQGITYAPRKRLQVYSEFTSSFDNAVSSTAEPETLEQATPAAAHEWDAEDIDTTETQTGHSKRTMFLIWLVPIIVIVIALTYIQQQIPASKPEAAKPVAVISPDTPAVPKDQDSMSDKAVLSAIAENRSPKSPAPVQTAAARPLTLPDFIPRAGLDKQFSASNPGWERYKGRVTEFKVLREAQAIRAIQVIDRGGQGLPESFMKGVLRQVTKNPSFGSVTSEKKEGYLIQRGHISENIKVVYYRDENGGKLRAFVITWQ
ncbi:MAG: hypothetical protein PHP95_02525 [Desulfuromonadaceae bacterium]|nr:hypothetical protein [Desulfuromonadaceae bacterium]MDD2847311.1 hypothetical protein [Desulfuromonadaceae bacterium]MDD4130255.1 hypothetical protein [Desulfuromonadaceae bacterium]